MPVRPPITTWLCEWKNDQSTAEAVRVSTRLVPSKGSVWAQVHAQRARRDHGAQTGRGGLFSVADRMFPPRARSSPSRRGCVEGYKNQHGIEPNFSFLKDPLIVNSLFLKKPARIEALGLVLLLALLLWRLMERSLRHHVDTTGTTMIGWDKKTTDRPTAFMMVTKFSGLIVVKVDQQRHLARALSSVQQQYLHGPECPGHLFHRPHQG